MTQRGQWIFVLAIIGTLGAGLIAGLLLTPSLQPVGVESEAPDFTAVNVISGDTVMFSSYRGQVVLLNVWATWCPPCVKEMPSMQRLYDELHDAGLRVVAVSVDDAGSEEVREWIAARALTFDVLQDRSGRIERIYQTTGVPESFVIDRDGVIVKKVIGPADWDHPSQIQLMRRLLGSHDTVEERVQ
jgi:peroxiredoxin